MSLVLKQVQESADWRTKSSCHHLLKKQLSGRRVNDLTPNRADVHSNRTGDDNSVIGFDGRCHSSCIAIVRREVPTVGKAGREAFHLAGAQSRSMRPQTG